MVSWVFYVGRNFAILDDLEIAPVSNLFRTDPDRFLALDLVNVFPVDAAATFSLAEGEPVRRFLTVTRKTFRVEHINNKAVRTTGVVTCASLLVVRGVHPCHPLGAG